MFEAGLVLVGCYLAFVSRNVDRQFGESKQLIFGMYNIALVGIVFLLLLSVADIDPSGSRLLQGVGVLWGTVFSSAAFVIPRLLTVRKDRTQGNGSARSVVAGDSPRFESGVSTRIGAINEESTSSNHEIKEKSAFQ